jgi:hypothetical protein
VVESLPAVRRVHLAWLAAALLMGALPRIDAVSRLYPADRDQRTDVRRYYASMAESALAGGGWVPSYPTNFIPPPGQAFFIFLGRLALPGADYQHLRSVQALTSLLTIAAAFAAGWLLRDPWVGVAAAWLTALDRRQSEMVGTLLPETNHVFLVIAALATLLLALRVPRRDLFAAAGFLLGLACLFKPTPTLLGPLLGAWLLVRAPGRRAFGLAYLLAFVAALAPWIVRNRVHYGHLLPVSTNGGTLLALANAPELDAARPDMTYWDDLYRRDYYKDPGIEARFAGLRDRDGKPEENLKDRAYLRRALGYMLRHPLHFARNYAYKLRSFLFLEPGGVAPAEGPLPFGTWPGLFSLVTILGLAGLILLAPQWKHGVAFATVAAVAYHLAFGALYHLTRDGRMTFTFRALLTLPAAYAAVWAAERAVRRFRGARATPP